MRIERRPFADGVMYLCVAGELGMATSGELHDTVAAAISDDRATKVVIDLAEVSFCDSIGIGALVRARTFAADRRVVLVVVNPRDLFRDVLEITGVLAALTDG